jgi:hypothetical protein
MKENVSAWQRPTLAGRTQLPLALKSLTAVFGMGTGVTSSLLPPDLNLTTLIFPNDKIYYTLSFKKKQVILK